MRLFGALSLAVFAAAVVVLAYDLFQAEIEKEKSEFRVVYDRRRQRFTFEKPSGAVQLVYASLFGPGEPVMRVHDKWISRFEQEYSDRLSEAPTRKLSAADKRQFVEKSLPRVESIAAEAARRAGRIEEVQRGSEREQVAEKLRLVGGVVAWLEERGVFGARVAPVTPAAKERIAPDEPNLAAQKAALTESRQVLDAMIGELRDLIADPQAADKVDVVARVAVKVERRWQGRWVLSANRPRFLTGREVPDIMVSSKMELFALIQDDYAVALDEPLPGEKVSPLAGPDTYGDPRRSWREAFIPAMLEEGKYAFLADPLRRNKVYLAPLWCNTYCLFYNRVLFRKAGIKKIPRTWPEFLAVCEQLKAAGIAPLTADQEVYANTWPMWLIWRAMGPQAWEDTISGVPRDQPPAQRQSDPPWTASGYREVYAQIRHLRERGYFKPGFRGSTWPAAQRGFAAGDAAMMICGSWLPQELGGYQDLESKEKFELGCFSFPRWPGGREEDQTAAQAGCCGMVVCRQGKATRHAVELVKYLSARDHHDMVHQNAQISCMKDADFPPALAEIEADFKNATAIYDRAPHIFARRFNAAVLTPLYNRFFLQEKGETGYLTVEEFLRELDRQTRRYLQAGGEEGYE